MIYCIIRQFQLFQSREQRNFVPDACDHVAFQRQALDICDVTNCLQKAEMRANEDHTPTEKKFSFE